MSRVPKQDPYGTPYIKDDKVRAYIDQVEKALGFPLYYWQKTYIAYGTFRGYGATTATVLQHLMDIDAPPIDIRSHTVSTKAYTSALTRLYTQLREAGVPTRAVLTKNDPLRTKRELLEKMADAYVEAGHVNIATPDELRAAMELAIQKHYINGGEIDGVRE